MSAPIPTPTHLPYTNTTSFIYQTAFADQVKNRFEDAAVHIQHQEVTVEIPVAHYLDLLYWLKTDDHLRFEQLADLCGVDYLEYPQAMPGRFAVVLHLLSVARNQRMRVRVYLDQAQPCIPSICDLWTSANWYEREAFDLFGIQFINHDDLRRILTDYDFIGHPLRKDFPTTGFIELRYDDEEKRIVRQAVTIETREITPRIQRESNYAQTDKP